MKKLIKAFPNHLESAIELGKGVSFSSNNTEIKNVLIIGLGGSGIGGTIVGELLGGEIAVPIVSLKSYFLPAFVDEGTLIIACSYSGNTEETLSAFDEAKSRGAQIFGITSGGELLDKLESDKLNHIKIPAGNPPRAMLGYSITSLFYALAANKLISFDFERQLLAAAKLLKSSQEEIIAEARSLADFFYQKIPVLYGANRMEGTLVRWRQQLNENAKMLCWHHVIPEMNHNELVGWRKEDGSFAVLFIRNDDDFSRIQKRMEINKELIRKYTPHIKEVYSKGDSTIQKAIYLIHLGDWLSLELSVKNEKDPVEIEVINQLKAELASFDE